MLLSKIIQILKDQPKIDIHEHLRPPSLISSKKVSLADLLPMSYMGFYDFYPGLKNPRFDTSKTVILTDPNILLNFIHGFPKQDIRNCFIKGINAVHHLNLNTPSLIVSEIDEHLQSAYTNSNLYRNAFDTLQIQQCICDIPYADLGYAIDKQLGSNFLPQIKPRALLRINSLLFGFDPKVWNPNTDLIAYYCEHILHLPRPTNFDDFLHLIDKILAWANTWSVGLKCASAYERTLNFGDSNHYQQLYERAKSVYGQDMYNLSESEWIQFGNYVFNYILSQNRKYKIPLQIHTGTAIESGSHPNNLKSVFQAFPQQSIELLHFGYPWVDSVLELLTQYPQVYSDFVWLPQLDTAILSKLVKKITQRNLWSKMMAFGGDCACIEGSIGALLSLIESLGSGFFEENVKNGLSAASIEDISAKIFYETPKQFFRL